MRIKSEARYISGVFNWAHRYQAERENISSNSADECLSLAIRFLREKYPNADERVVINKVLNSTLGGRPKYLSLEQTWKKSHLSKKRKKKK